MAFSPQVLVLPRAILRVSRVMISFVRPIFLFICYLSFVVGCNRGPKKQLNASKLHCERSWGHSQVQKSRCLLITSTKENAAQIRFSTPDWNTTDENLYIQVKVSEVKKIKGMRFQFLSGDQKIFTYELPVFSDPDFNLVRDGQFVTLSFPLSEMTRHQPGMQQVHQANLFVTTSVGESVQVQLGTVRVLKKKQKQGFVTLTFDDGFASNHKAAEIAKKFSFPGTAYLIPDAIGTPGYLDKTQVQAMKAWGWDLASHHSLPVTGFENKKLISVFSQVKKYLVDTFSSASSKHLAYPLGKQNKLTSKAVESLFDTARLAGGGTETLPVGDPHRIKAINVLPSMSPDQLFSKALQAHRNGDWAVFMFHTIDQPEKGDLDYSSENFETFLQQLKQSNIQVKSVSKVKIQ